jgi:hypothetical protein
MAGLACLSHDPGMHGPTLEQMNAELELLIARRRADHHAPQTASWKAAIKAVRECEDRFRAIDVHAARRESIHIGRSE